MKSRRNPKKNKKTLKTRKSLRGGFFSSGSVIPSEQCDVNKLTELKTSDEMHQKYQTCCPKGMFGTKNSSAYCKQLDLNFQSKLKSDNDALEPSKEQTPSVQVHPSDAAASAPQSPWYKFWGGKRRRSHRKRKSSRRYRK